MNLTRIQIRATLYEVLRNGRPPRDLRPPLPAALSRPGPARAVAESEGPSSDRTSAPAPASG